MSLERGERGLRRASTRILSPLCIHRWSHFLRRVADTASVKPRVRRCSELLHGHHLPVRLEDGGHRQCLPAEDADQCLLRLLAAMLSSRCQRARQQACDGTRRSSRRRGVTAMEERQGGNGHGGARGGGARREALPRVVQRGGAMLRGAGTLRWRASTWCASCAASTCRLVRRRGGAWEEVARRARPGGGVGGRKMDIFCEDSESRWKHSFYQGTKSVGPMMVCPYFMVGHGFSVVMARPLTCGPGSACR
jgi:hypothetical protein